MPSLRAIDISRALNGRKSGRGFIACCPAHDDRNASLSICDAADGKVLVRCHAGCDQALVISTLRERNLWSAGASDRTPPTTKKPQHHVIEPAAPHEFALSIWKKAVPIAGTIAEAYLQSRALQAPAPDALRFHPGLKHPAGAHWPAMVSLVTRATDGTPLGIHRTFLARDGSAKAPVEPARMMLGPSRGGVVRLAAVGRLLMIGEGIETCLSTMQATRLPAWAALSTSGLRAAELPAEIAQIIILADGDAPGEAAAQDCAARWSAEGRRVSIARPPSGHDFNDVLMGRARHNEEAA